MKIYTRAGDDGETVLLGGRRVSKSDARVIAYGEIDELNASLGAALTLDPAMPQDELLASIQRDLLAIGAQLAAPEPERVSSLLKKAALDALRIEELERAIDEAENRLPPLKAFVIPGGTPRASALHVARTVCRRAERTAVRLSLSEPVPNLILVYLNRLSDLLFTFARLANARENEPEATW